MSLNPFATMSCSWFYTCLCFFLVTIISTNSSPTPKTTVSYADHCSSFVPESSTTTRIRRSSVPTLLTPYLTGGDKLLGVKQQNQSFYYMGKFLKLRVAPNYQKTTTEGVYKVEGFLSIRSPYQYYSNESDSTGYAGSYYRRSSRARGSIRFLLTGFWSEVSRKLCMVGSASMQAVGIRSGSLDAVLKLRFASEAPNIYTSVVSGTLGSISSVANDPGYFEPIFVFQFPELSKYSYSLVSGEIGGGLVSEVAEKNRPSGWQPIKICSAFLSVLEMEYDGMRSQIGLLSSRFLALNPIQCSVDGKKLRFTAKLQNISYVDQEFDLESTFIGEASWDDKKNELSGVACRLLNPADNPEHAVGGCTMRLSLKYNTIWTLRNEPKAVGRFWSTKKVDDSGYFRKVNLTSFDLVSFPDLRYEYSELGRAKKLCPVKKPTKKGNIYPDGHSYDMRFDMSVKSSKGEEIAWGFAKPVSVGNDLYDRNNMVAGVYSTLSDAFAPTSFSEPVRSTNIAPTNISYKITIHPSKANFVNLFPNLKLSREFQLLDITAEGVYNAENGYLCMVGCGKMITYMKNSTHTSTDCEILVKFQFASLNDKKGGLIKGTIESGRNKSDPLRFEDIKLSSAAYYGEAAEMSIWRMDLEITMVLISKTLSCVFIGLQILHVKRNPEVLSRISLVMLVILCLGHMIPLVLNFEAVFLGSHNKQTLFMSSDGYLEANEVAVRVITMVAFLLQIRLVQLVWTAKQSEGSEKKSIFILFPLYIFGCLIALLLNWIRDRKYSLWGDLRSYAGLILDGFLFPQILLNVFGGSAEKVLARSFYVGTSAVRLVPHAYNQYRVHNYPTYGLNGTYYYANPGADLYSTAWDVLIPCGVIVLAVIVFLQQRNGGRWILPQRFRELELYEKVPTLVDE
ncbi:hypothetical protein CASFOL_024400 [Castilleja foliolosa]|uniref:RING-type E3 ubiquitin transferase n=1 Tax=Castilleja foliolosa TaxID=1961234 RepID=A0ABD3CN70_9LAMI